LKQATRLSNRLFEWPDWSFDEKEEWQSDHQFSVYSLIITTFVVVFNLYTITHFGWQQYCGWDYFIFGCIFSVAGVAFVDAFTHLHRNVNGKSDVESITSSIRNMTKMYNDFYERTQSDDEPVAK